MPRLPFPAWSHAKRSTLPRSPAPWLCLPCACPARDRHWQCWGDGLLAPQAHFPLSCFGSPPNAHTCPSDISSLDQIALDIARALVYLHAKRIVHLDVKSANALLAR